MTDFELRVNQMKYGGWTSLALTRSLEQLAHSFNVGLTDKWDPDQEPVPVKAEDACTILVDKKLITTGYIDEDSSNSSSGQHSLTFTGRSKTSDLVDCAAIHKGGQWRNTGLLQIATDLCTPFSVGIGTSVTMEKKFTSFKIQEGETVFECLNRGARARGVLMQTDAEGRLTFDRAGNDRVVTKLEWGKNILQSSKRNNQEGRFSEYIVKTQSSGNDQRSGAATSIKRRALDPFVTRHRPTIIMADDEDSGTELEKRAEWERNTRIGQSLKYSCTVQGWTHADGLWNPNALVRVIDPTARIDDELLIVSVTFSRDNQGTTTSLDLTLKEAFDIQPLPKAKKKKGSLYPP